MPCKIQFPGLTFYDCRMVTLTVSHSGQKEAPGASRGLQGGGQASAYPITYEALPPVS